MDRFEYTDPQLRPGENVLHQDEPVSLCDGDAKTSYKEGELVVTNLRMLWGRSGDIKRGTTCLGLQLHYVVYIEEEQRTFAIGSSRKFVLHLSQPRADKAQGPVPWSQHNHVKLSIKKDTSSDFMSILRDALLTRAWERVNISMPAAQSSTTTSGQVDRRFRAGIVGIERKITEQQRATDESISAAFQDLSRLMGMAKDMVALSRNISTKIRDKQGDITEDETVRFKSYLLSLGIDDPVTRGAFTSVNEYNHNLAQQLVQMLLEPIKEVGGMMSMTDVYCRVNRARGLELLSPEDLMTACQLMAPLKLPLRLRKFDSGATVLQLSDHSEEAIIQSTALAVSALAKSPELEENGSLSAAELSKIVGVSVLLAKERLLTAEKFGSACRDESLEGTRFYPNMFLTRDD